MDGGANGGVLGNDAIVLECVDNATVDLTGVGNLTVDNLKIALGASCVETIDGPIIL